FSSRRRHTRSDRDWSSDVCSSDLLLRRVLEGDRPARRPCDEAELELLVELVDLDDDAVDLVLQLVAPALPLAVILDDLVDRGQQIGRASCRERVEIGEGGVALKYD